MNERRRKTDFEVPSQRELDTNHTELFALLREIRDRQVGNAVSLGKVEIHVENLAGPQGRVTKLENTNTRQWWLHAAVLPLVFIIKGVTKHLGLDA